MMMPFGKYRDWELTKVPKHYLLWLRNQKWLGPWLAKEIDDVLTGKTVAPSDESFEEALKTWEKDAEGDRRRAKHPEQQQKTSLTSEEISEVTP